MLLQYITLALLLCLTGCVNYSGMHATTKPLDNTALSIHPHYATNRSSTTSINWWEKFHDPQLNQLIQIALDDSPTLQSAESRVAMAQQMAAGASATLWPTFSANGSVARERLSANTVYPPPLGGNTFNEATVGLNFKYEFDWWGKNRETLKARISASNAAEADLAAARLILTTSIANTYLQLQNASAQKKIADYILQEQKVLLSIIKDRAKNNIVSEIPVSTATTNVQTAEITANQFQQAVLLAQHQLAVLLGKNPLTTDIPYSKLTILHLTLPKVIPANLLANRPDILASRLRMEAAAHEINVAKARFFPNINLTAMFSLQSFGFNNLFKSDSQDNSVGAAIDLPIFDAGARRANLGVKYAEYDEAVSQYNQTILTALREVADQLSILQTLEKQLRAQTNALKASEQNYQLTNKRYQHGITEYLQVLSMKEISAQQKASTLQLQTQYQQAVIGMIKAVGGNV